MTQFQEELPAPPSGHAGQPAAAKPPARGLLATEGWAGLLADRLIPGCAFFMVALAKAYDLYNVVLTAGRPATALGAIAFTASIAYRLCVVCFFLLAVMLFVIRARPVRKTQAALPGVLAIVASFMMTAVAFVPARSAGVAQTAVAATVLLAGNIIAAAGLWTLGRSFSILPEARQLITSGPYAVIRHPMYLGEILAGCGMVIMSLSVPSALIFVLFVILQVQRSKYEEDILLQTFPEYEAYKLKTARLLPGIF